MSQSFQNVEDVRDGMGKTDFKRGRVFVEYNLLHNNSMK